LLAAFPCCKRHVFPNVLFIVFSFVFSGLQNHITMHVSLAHRGKTPGGSEGNLHTLTSSPKVLIEGKSNVEEALAATRYRFFHTFDTYSFTFC